MSSWHRSSNECDRSSYFNCDIQFPLTARCDTRYLAKQMYLCAKTMLGKTVLKTYEHKIRETGLIANPFQLTKNNFLESLFWWPVLLSLEFVLQHLPQIRRNGIPFTQSKVYCIFHMPKSRSRSKPGMIDTRIARVSITMEAPWKPINWAAKESSERPSKWHQWRPMKRWMISLVCKWMVQVKTASSRSPFCQIAEIST